MTQGNYRPVAGQPMNPREWRRVMEEMQNQPTENQAQAQNQTEAQAAEQQNIPSREETEAMERQRTEAAALLNGNGPSAPGAAQTRVMDGPYQLPLQAPDGGPLKVAPELVLQLRMLMIGAGIGAVIVTILVMRARLQGVQPPAPVADKEADK